MRVARSELYAGRALLLGMVAITILPFLSIFLTALHPSGSVPVGLAWPAEPAWGNFIEAFQVANMRALLASSVFIVVAVVPVSLVISTMAGFGIGLLRIPGARWLLLLLFIFGLTLPFEGIITPLYFLAREMGILNTRFAIVLPLIGLFMPFAVFWMRAHFVNMPAEISEAAQGRRREYLGPVLADSRPARTRADGVARDPHVGLGVEPVPARPGPRRGPHRADDGGGAGCVPGALRDGHPAPLRRDDPDPPADADRLHPLPAPDHLGAPAGVREGMTSDLEFANVRAAIGACPACPRPRSIPRPQLLTYPDSLGGTLRDIGDLLAGPLDGLFRGVHILPPFPSSGDRGFAPITYDEIEPRFGSWDDIRRISERHDVLLDLMINHISRESPEFQDFPARAGDRHTRTCS